MKYILVLFAGGFAEALERLLPSVSTFGMNSVWIKHTEQQRMDPRGVHAAAHTIQSLSELESYY